MKKNSGQTFVEFLFLILVVVSLGFAMLQLANRAIAERWQAMITLIASPTNTTIEVR